MLSLIPFLLLAIVLILFSMKRPEKTIFICICLIPLGFAGTQIPFPGLKNIGLTQILMACLIVSSITIYSKERPMIKLNYIEVIIVLFSFYYSILIFQQPTSFIKSMWRLIIVIPWYFIWFSIKIFVVDENRLLMIKNAFIFQLLIINVFTLIEFFSGFNLYAYSNPNYANLVVQLDRYGLTRSNGALFPHPVPAAVYLSLILPFSFLDIKVSYFSKMIVVSSFFSLFYYQSRAAIFGMFIAVIFTSLFSSKFRRHLFNVKTITIAVLLLLLLFNFVKISAHYVDMLRYSLDFSQTESINFTTRYPDFFRAINLTWEIPFFGFGIDTEATISVFRLVNEQPWFIDNMFRGGIIFGLISEFYLIMGTFYLSSLLIRDKNIPLAFKSASLIGFLSQAIAMHLNRDSYGIVTSFIILASMEMAKKIYASKVGYIQDSGTSLLH